MELGSDTLHLRPPALHDVEWLIEACNDPEIHRFTTIPSPYGRKEAIDFIRRAQGDAADEDGYAFIVCETATGQQLGACGVRHPSEPEVEIGYWVAAVARGRGVATGAVQLMVDHVFDQLDADAVRALVIEENTASARVVRRLGFEVIDTVDGEVCAHPGESVEVWRRDAPAAAVGPDATTGPGSGRSESRAG